VKPARKNENLFANIAFNIVIPVLILNKGSKFFENNGATYALILALAFPIFYGAYDYIKKGEKNYISLLGVANVVFTGGLALMKTEGIWFAIKEAAFPLIIGIFVFITAYTKKPAIKFMICNENVMNMDKVFAVLTERGTLPLFNIHLKRSTQFLAYSFFLSAALNFFLAIRIFTKIDPNLPEKQYEEILNSQIADMTTYGYLVIALPSMIILGLILMYLLRGLKSLTGLELEEIFHVAQPNKKEFY
jgi:intracellular septation protein A